MDGEALRQHRRDRDEFFRSHYASPLSEEDQDHFCGLAYFPPDPDMVFTGRFTPTQGAVAEITSSAGTTSTYHQMGVLDVEILGTDYSLVVLDDGDGNPFIAFGDPTNGDTTYGGGRYVGVAIHDNGSASIDFDLASNPYCVYDEEFVCPLPPIENRISVPVEAGEMLYAGPATL